MTNLHPSAVLRKTESGLNAMKQRDRALTPRLRMLLIMVNGSKTVAELLKGMPDADEVRPLFGDLLSAGLVEALDGPEPAPAQAPAQTPASVPAATPALAAPGGMPQGDLKTITRRATRLLNDMLGPDSERLCLQIERCTSAEQLNAKIIEISRIVAAMRSEKKGAEFLQAATA